MRIRNLVIEDSPAKLFQLLDDYKFIGFDAEIKNGKLTIYCINRKLKSRKQKNREAKANRKNRPAKKDN